MKRFLTRFLRDNRGVAALEYALLVGLVTLAIAGALSSTNIRTSISSIFTSLNSELSTAAGAKND
ncbi:Flp family type IVb pilin [Magnetospirillum fulvum]|uniref:PilA-like pilus subunit protein n=1 Tax=Magnetospirillum fulvum MGU-K5 TaxID=1316936 RepID=S9S8Y9_MAGFU|nr:Flp family type IVb pilin [Magnetospirillum fulvum]EPY01134.1 PilA-like pilus subunit protein [Magnetospirillum fulvum MGU-K5]